MEGDGRGLKSLIIFLSHQQTQLGGSIASTEIPKSRETAIEPQSLFTFIKIQVRIQRPRKHKKPMRHLIQHPIDNLFYRPVISDNSWNHSINEMEESNSCSGRCVRTLYVVWKVFTCLFTHVMLVTLVVGYCLFGAWLFKLLEADNERFVRRNITYARGNLTAELWRFSQAQLVFHQENWTRYVMHRVEGFERDLVLAMRKSGWDGVEDDIVHNWTFTGALFYSIIVITTIGYGHIAPKTYPGKVATIFYAIVGIPLMLLCLSNIGDLMANSFRFIYWRVCCYSCSKAEAQGRQNSRRRQRSSYYGSEKSRRSDTSRGGYPDRVSRLKPRYPLEAEDWEIVDEEDLAMKERGRRSQSKGRSVGSPARHPPGAAEPGNKTPVLFNKYALDEEASKGQFGLAKEEPDPAVKPQRNLGPPSRRQASQEQLNTSPRIMSPMGFIVARQNQAKPRDLYLYSEENISGSAPIKPVPIWLCVFLVVSYIIGGAVLFSDWEKWTYSDSAYFCFITLTTIGFGDYVPAQRVSEEEGKLNIALCSLYLLFGIALLAMSFNLVQEEVITNVKNVARHIGIIKDEYELDE